MTDTDHQLDPATDLRDAEERIALLAASLQMHLDRYSPRPSCTVNRATLAELLALLAVRPVAAQERIDTALAVHAEQVARYGADSSAMLAADRMHRALTRTIS